MAHWLVLPVYNEYQALRHIYPHISKFYDEVLIVDGNSTDGSKKLTKSYNFDLIVQKGSGKGWGIRQSFEYLHNRDVDTVCILDADGTCSIKEAINYQRSLETDILIGNRFHEGRPPVMDGFSYLINHLVSRIISVKAGYPFKDVQSPFWIINQSALRIFRKNLTATKFDLEIDMALTAKNHDLSITQGPISYYHRYGKSKFSYSERLGQIWKIWRHLHK